MKKNNKEMRRYWKYLSKGNRSSYGGHKWKIGKWYKKKGKLVMCENGFHCSDNIADAIFWAKAGDLLAEVEISGETLEDSGFNKICCEKMKVINTWERNMNNDLEITKCYCSFAIKNYEKYGLRSQLKRIQGYMFATQYRGFFIGSNLDGSTCIAESGKGTADNYEVSAPSGYMYITIKDKKLHHQFLRECKEPVHNKVLEVFGI